MNLEILRKETQMSPEARNHLMSKALRRVPLIAFILLLALPAALRAQQNDDFDDYKVRIDAFWFYSNPSGNIQGSVSGDSASVDLQKDLGFNTYSTFAGKIDWKFTRKNHFYVAASPFDTSRQTTLSRSFIFQGQTFEAGLVTQSDLHAVLVAPGYQYDIIRQSADILESRCRSIYLIRQQKSVPRPR